MIAKLPLPSKSDHKQIWQLAAPIIIANLSVPLLGAVDTAVGGNAFKIIKKGATDADFALAVSGDWDDVFVHNDRETEDALWCIVPYPDPTIIVE